MSEFNIGDRVEVTRSYASGASVEAGDKGTVTALRGATACSVKMDSPREDVTPDSDGSHWGFGAGDLRKIVDEATSDESAHERDIRILGDELVRMAREHNYCSDFDRFVERMNADGQLTVKLKGRVPAFTFQYGDVVCGYSDWPLVRNTANISGRWTGPVAEVAGLDDTGLLQSWHRGYRLVSRDGQPYDGPQPQVS